MRCQVCGTPFDPRKNSKTCGLQCSRTLRRRQKREYDQINAPIRRMKRKAANEVIVHRRFGRHIDRAVRLLFAHPS